MEIKPAAAGVEGPGAGAVLWPGPHGGMYKVAISKDKAEMQNSSAAADVKPPTLTSMNKEGRKRSWLVRARAVVWMYFWWQI